jgi:phosphopantothenoylcysteine decarboxylase/phosphopantothenate--cysteine ligase
MKHPQAPKGSVAGHNLPTGSDLAVKLVSEALAGVHLDVVVSGSIGAVESIRFVRALRRLGADVTPWLTSGGAQFVTPLALGWAAARECRTGFEADASHLAEGQACIVAPASASFIAKIANGITDSPASALVTSYLGWKRPVIILPSMHDSLAHAPQVQANLEKLRQSSPNVVILGSRLEEGKHKVPEPAILADHCAHAYNNAILKNKRAPCRVLLTLGGTRAWIDDVRFLGNYSTGRLGTLITEELHRLGLDVDVLAGSAEYLPRCHHSLTRVATHEDLAREAKKIAGQNPDALVHAAAVLDFAPATKATGKTPSSAGKQTVELVPTAKILDDLKIKGPAKVAFKLEAGVDEHKAAVIARDYITRHGLTMLVVNNLSDVSAERHKAWIFETQKAGQPVERPYEASSKDEVAKAVARHVWERLTRHA